MAQIGIADRAGACGVEHHSALAACFADQSVGGGARRVGCNRNNSLHSPQIISRILSDFWNRWIFHQPDCDVHRIDAFLCFGADAVGDFSAIDRQGCVAAQASARRIELLECGRGKKFVGPAFLKCFTLQQEDACWDPIFSNAGRPHRAPVRGRWSAFRGPN